MSEEAKKKNEDILEDTEENVMYVIIVRNKNWTGHFVSDDGIY